MIELNLSRPVLLGEDIRFPNPEIADAEGLVAIGGNLIVIAWIRLQCLAKHPLRLACTILVGELKNGEVKYETMTSCLMPLGNANRKHIVTIEGINGDELTPIQSELIEKNGTQCGFCTPGVVLSLYGFCLSDKQRNLENAVEAIGGNICRCTGYKSIERAAAAIVERLQPMGKADPVPWLVQRKFLAGYFLEIPARL